MKVFISWSGERSRQAAEAIRVWLPRVIQSVKPWMSDADIEAGSRWLTEVSSVLDETSIGIICVTPENLHSPWLHFEAGALSKALDQSRICPVGLNMKPGQISGPLSQFQAVTLDEAGMLKVLSGLNKFMGDAGLAPAELEEIFAVWWPKLQERLDAIPPASAPLPLRSADDQLEELLQLAREQQRRENLRIEALGQKDDKIDEVIKLLERSASAIEPIKASINGYQSKMMDSIKAIAQSGEVAGADEKFVAALMNIVGAALSSSNGMDVDMGVINGLTDHLRNMQEESKMLATQLLSKPVDGSSDAGHQ
jgi:hypothetical protein